MTRPFEEPAHDRTTRSALYCLLALQFAYGVAFVLRSSLLLDGVRHFVLFDDAMISLTYARTWLAGEGLVWFPGAERVQGITNPLWTGFMAATLLLPLPQNLAPLPLQLLGVALVPLSAHAAYGIAQRSFAALLPGSGLVVAALVGFYFPFYQWSGLGMEAGWITFVLLRAIRSALDADRRSSPSHEFLVWLALGVLTRLDFAIFGALLAAVVFVWPSQGGGRRAEGLRAFAVVGASVSLVLLGQWLYYGNPLPNTFALKLGVPVSVRFAAGLESTLRFVLCFSPIAFALALATPWLRAMAPRASALLVGPIVAALAYNLYAGGDAWEWGPVANRFVLPAATLLLILLAGGIDLAIRKSSLAGRGATLALVAAALLVVIRVNSGGEASASNVFARWNEALLRTPPLNRETHDLPYLKAGLLLREASPTPLRIAVSSAGITPWALARGRFVDLLGKSDRHVARTPPQVVPFVPGHVKWDLAYSIDRLDPDVCLGTWCRRPHAYPEPMAVIAGPYNLYVKRRVLEEKFVSLRALHAAYRRLDYGADRDFFLGLLDLRGFGFSADGEGFDMAQSGSLFVPANERVSFTVRAYGAYRVNLFSKSESRGGFDLEAGARERVRLQGHTGTRIRIEAAPLAGSTARGQATLSLRDFEFE